MSFSFSPLPLSKPEEILQDLSPFFLLYKDGRIERLFGEVVVASSTDPGTGVRSKDVVISLETGLSARLYLPESITSHEQKVPLLIYFHEGGFVTGSATSAEFQPFLNKLALDANIVIVSVDYRKAPEHVYPTPYDDSWEAIKWVVSHATGHIGDPWLNNYVNFNHLFFGGASAGANIAQQMGMRIGLEKGGLNFRDQVKLVGIILIHPYFWGETLIGGEVIADAKERNVLENLWWVTNPSSTRGLDDPLINPALDPNLSKLGCKRVIVCVAEKDLLRDRGWYYYDAMKKSGWNGEIDITEAKGEGHVFHLFTPFTENASNLFKTLSVFINGDE